MAGKLKRPLTVGTLKCQTFAHTLARQDWVQTIDGDTRWRSRDMLLDLLRFVAQGKEAQAAGVSAYVAESARYDKLDERS